MRSPPRPKERRGDRSRRAERAAGPRRGHGSGRPSRPAVTWPGRGTRALWRGQLGPRAATAKAGREGHCAAPSAPGRCGPGPASARGQAQRLSLTSARAWGDGCHGCSAKRLGAGRESRPPPLRALPPSPFFFSSSSSSAAPRELKLRGLKSVSRGQGILWLLMGKADKINSPSRGFSVPMFPESSTTQIGSLEAVLRLDPLEPAEKKKCCYIDTQSALIPSAFFPCKKTFFDFSLLSRLNDQLNKYQLQATFPTAPFPSRPSPGIADICVWLPGLNPPLGASVCSGAGLGEAEGASRFLSFDLCWDKKSRLKGQGKQLQDFYCLNSMPNKLILGIWNDPFMGISTSLGIVQADFMGHAQLFWGRGWQCWSSAAPLFKEEEVQGRRRALQPGLTLLELP